MWMNVPEACQCAIATECVKTQLAASLVTAIQDSLDPPVVLVSFALVTFLCTPIKSEQLFYAHAISGRNCSVDLVWQTTQTLVATSPARTGDSVFVSVPPWTTPAPALLASSATTVKLVSMHPDGFCPQRLPKYKGNAEEVKLHQTDVRDGQEFWERIPP